MTVLIGLWCLDWMNTSSVHYTTEAYLYQIIILLTPWKKTVSFCFSCNSRFDSTDCICFYNLSECRSYVGVCHWKCHNGIVYFIRSARELPNGCKKQRKWPFLGIPCSCDKNLHCYGVDGWGNVWNLGSHLQCVLTLGKLTACFRPNRFTWQRALHVRMYCVFVCFLTQIIIIAYLIIIPLQCNVITDTLIYPIAENKKKTLFTYLAI